MMLTHRVFHPIYRLLQRTMVLEAVSVMTAPATAVAASAFSRTEVEVRELNADMLQEFVDRGEAPYTQPFVQRLNEPRLTCVGAVADGRLLSFAFFHQGSAEREMNYGRTPATATRIALEPDAAFVFHAYTAPEARGQRLLSEVLSYGADVLRRSKGVHSLVTTTEVVNRAARAAFRRAGFGDAGTYWRFGIGSKVFGRYPQPIPPIIAYEPR